MYKEFDDIKAETEIMKEFEEVEDYNETNEALKELYPDADITFNDIISGKHPDSDEGFKGKNIMNRSSSTVNQTKSLIEPYGSRNSISNKKNNKLGDRSINAYGERRFSSQEVLNQSSISTLAHSRSPDDLINILPNIKSRSPMKNIDSPFSKYIDPLGVRRLGVYSKNRFSVSNRGRENPYSHSTSVVNKSMASAKTKRFVRSIHYE